MNRTQIEWVKNPDGSQGYSWNPFSGCLNHTPEGLCLAGLFPCYAWKLAHTRLKKRYLANHAIATGSFQAPFGRPVEPYKDPFYPRFWEERLLKPAKGLSAYLRTKPKGIFVCDMGDLFGIGVPEEWTRRVLDQCKTFSQHRFYILTKQAQRLPEFSPFPDNCWVGVTATNAKMLREALTYLERIKAKVKFVSLEPLLSRIYDPLQFLNSLPDFLSVLDWLIIGACTGTWRDMYKLQQKYPELISVPLDKTGQNRTLWTAQPRIEWLREIVEAADTAGVKVFLKDNLRPLLPYPNHLWAFTKVGGLLRQEMPT